MAAVKAGANYGFIDKKGKLVIPAKYEEVHSFFRKGWLLLK
ncbi:WG repeat-containing protein [Paenibacillus rhizoplanae]